MIWKYLGVFFLATFKFLFAPYAGSQITEGNWLYTYLVVVFGGMAGVTFFYYSARFFMERSAKKRLKSNKIKKKFTRTNKTIIKVKNKVGVYGLAVLTALILSIPIGSIITAKFYRHKKSTIFILYGGVLFVGGILTFIVYTFF